MRINSSSSLIPSAFNKLNKTADKISKTGELTPQNASDMIQSQRLTQIGAGVIKAEDKMLGDLLDILA